MRKLPGEERCRVSSLICGAILLCGSLASAETFDFDRDWFFGWAGAGELAPVSLPHAPNAGEAFRTVASDAGGGGVTRGTCVYRKAFTLPCEGEKVFLEFETIRQAIYLKVNERLVGYYEAGVAPVGFDITDYLVEGTNVVEATLDNTSARGMKNYLVETMPGHEPGDRSGTAYQWNTSDFNPVQGGLTGHVRLHVKPKTYLTLPLYNNLKTVGTYVTASDFDFGAGAATIRVEAEVRNEAASPARVSCLVSLVDPATTNVIATFASTAVDVASVAATNCLTAVESDVYDVSNAVPTRVVQNGAVKIVASTRVEGLEFWSPEHPKLYEVKVELIDGDAVREAREPYQVVDAATVTTGFRSVGYDPSRGVLINGKPVWLRGYAQRSTDEWAAIGVAPDWLQEFDAKLIRDSGANFVRWMHVAPKPAPVRAFDRYGIVSVAPAGDKEADVSGRAWSQRTEAMRDAMIYFRNSPSIVFWEAGNNAISAEHMREMRLLKETVDPACGRLMGCRSLQSAQAIAEAEWVGTMLARHGEKAFAVMRELGTYKPILELEYAREESPRRWLAEAHGKESPTGEAQDGYDVYNLSQQDFVWSNLSTSDGYGYFYGNRVGGRRLPLYSGCAMLCWSDSNQHGRNCYSENCRVSGRVDPIRIPKVSYEAMSAVFSAAPKVRLFRGKSVYALASATCARVDLLVDGEVKGSIREPERIYYYDFGLIENADASTLVAIAYDRQGVELSRDTVYPIGEGVRLVLEPHVQSGGWRADGSDIAFVDVRLVDAEGRVVETATNKVAFSFRLQPSTSNLQPSTCAAQPRFMGGYNSGVYGEASPIGQDWVNLECGVNRVFLRAGTIPGVVALTAVGADLPGGPQTVEMTLCDDRNVAAPLLTPSYAETCELEEMHDLDWHGWSDGGTAVRTVVTNGITYLFGPNAMTGATIRLSGHYRVATPADLPGYAHHLAFPTNTVDATIMNGHPVCRETNFAWKVDSPWTNETTFAVFQALATPAYGSVMIDTSDTGGKNGSSRWYIGRHNTLEKWECYNYNGWKGSANLRLNGEPGAAVTKLPVVMTVTNRWTRYTTSKIQFGGRYDMAWGEALTYGRRLSVDEMACVENYLMGKWGILPENNTFPETASLVFAAGSVLDLNGSTQRVARASGVGAVVNGVLLTDDGSAPSSDTDHPATTLVWADDDGDGYWRNGGNWTTNGVPCYFYPCAQDTAVFPSNALEEVAYAVRLDGYEVSVSNLVLGADLTLSNGRLVPGTVSGTGSLTLGDAMELSERDGGTVVDVPLVVTGSAGAPNRISLRTSGLRVNGPLLGGGHLVVEAARNLNYKGVKFAGDNGAFQGTVEIKANNIDRNDSVLAGGLSASSNAVWIINNSDRGNFVTSGDRTHAFGSLSGSVSMYSQSTGNRIVFEVGHLGLDDTLAGDFYGNYPELVSTRGHTIRKVGAGTLSFSGSHVKAYEAVGGTLEILNEQGLSWYASRTKTTNTVSAVKFLGGVIRQGPESETDLSPFVSGDGSVAVFDDGGVDRLWSTAIPASFGDFEKRGSGRLTLAEPPGQSGDLILAEGGLALPAGTSLKTLTLGDGTTLKLAAGSVSAERVVIEGALKLELDRLPENGLVLPLADGILQEAVLMLSIGDDLVTGYTLVEEKDGLYLRVPDGVQVGDRSYATLAGALAAVRDGETIVLNKDQELALDVDLRATDVILDLNGHTVSSRGRWAVVVGDKSLTVRNGTWIAVDCGFYLTDGSLALESVTVRSVRRAVQVWGAGRLDVGRTSVLAVSGTDVAVFACGSLAGRATVKVKGRVRTAQCPRYAGAANDSFGVDWQIVSPGFMIVIDGTTGDRPVMPKIAERLPLATDGSTGEVMPFPAPTTAYDYGKLKRERLGRGLVAVRRDATSVFVTWRYLESDAQTRTFDVYRDGVKLNAAPIADRTYFVDEAYDGAAHVYTVDGAEFRVAADAPIGYLEIPLAVPESAVTPAGDVYTYSPGDCSVGDVDGDGEFEIVLKWNPSNAKDNASSGQTGNVYYECLELDGTSRWRIDMGRNIRAGEHYSPFMVGDFDGDGKAELVVKTADGTVDGQGHVIGDAAADYRQANGYILSGPEYLTVFDGETGAAVDTVGYVPERGPIAEWKWTKPYGWGDQYGNRVDRFLATPAYLDGERLSVVMCRGYYKRTALTAWDFDGTNLVRRWAFDTTNTLWGVAYQGQGFHSLRTGDVDGDGKDEIVYGQMVVDHDGTGLYSTDIGHGDAMHLFQMSPLKKGLQVFTCQEASPYGCVLREAGTGEIIFRKSAGGDTGRCNAADVDVTNPGFEVWASSGLGLFDCAGNSLAGTDGLSTSMLVWWTGALTRDMLPGTEVRTYTIAGGGKLHTKFEGVSTINSTKSVPCLQGDLFGDWREEVILRRSDNAALRLYVSTEPTDYRFHTFLHDPVYRHSLANENVGYNQPTQTGFYFGPDLKGHAIRFRGTVMR